MKTIWMGFGEMLSCIPDRSFDTQSLHAKSLMIDQLEHKANFSKTRELGLIGNGLFEADNSLLTGLVGV